MGELDDAGNRSTEKRAHWLMNPEPDHRRPRDRSSPEIRGLTLTAKCEKTLQSIGEKRTVFFIKSLLNRHLLDFLSAIFKF